jgi:predicted nucleic acid-binding Zn ribbon protein
MAQEPPLRAARLPTRPCPRCGFPVPVGQRFCSNCAFPQPIRHTNFLIVILALLALVVILSLLFGWANPGGTRPPVQSSPIRGIARTATPARPLATPVPTSSPDSGVVPRSAAGACWACPVSCWHL